MKRLLPVLMMLHVLLLGGCQTLDQVLNVNSTVSAKKSTTYNPEHLKRLKETNKCPECDLQGANLRRAFLPETNFENANLSGALIDSRGRAIAKTSGAIGLSE